jgi:transposase InsO family protein
VGWQLAGHMRTTLVLDALRMALHLRGPGADVALVHHSDRGSQPGLNRSSQQCVRGVNVRSARDGCAGFTVATSAGVTRLSSRRPARRAGRSGDSRVRAGRGPPA